jgi:hypothetical protein
MLMLHALCESELQWCSDSYALTGARLRAQVIATIHSFEFGSRQVSVCCTRVNALPRVPRAEKGQP